MCALSPRPSPFPGTILLVLRPTMFRYEGRRGGLGSRQVSSWWAASSLQIRSGFDEHRLEGVDGSAQKS